MKIFVPYITVRDNALKLAHEIHCDGFAPDVIYVSLRGGAYLGNVISEYFKLMNTAHELKPVLYAAVVARSYGAPTPSSPHKVKVSVDGWTYNPEYLRDGDRVLLIDDIYDTGNTINHLAQIIIQNGIQSQNLKIAVHDYREHLDPDDDLRILPNYYCRKLSFNSDGSADWIHYLSHELVGLTESEIREHYAPPAQAILTDQHSKTAAR